MIDMQDLTKAQKEYFKDTKIKDENGVLLVCYHSTNHEFDVFNKDSIQRGPGFWFTVDKSYSEKHGDNLHAVYLNIKNPFYTENIDLQYQYLSEFSEKQGLADGEWPYKDYYPKEFGEFLQSKGYDGMMWEYRGEYTIIAFEPNQIKLTTNLYPTQSNDFKDNSRDYLNKHLKDMTVAECCKISKHISQMEKQNRTKNVTKDLNKNNKEER